MKSAIIRMQSPSGIIARIRIRIGRGEKEAEKKKEKKDCFMCKNDVNRF